MNRAADGSYYPFQLFSRFVFTRPREIYYIGGNDILPPPLTPEQESDVLECLGTEREKEETAAYLAELEEDIVTVDGLISFAESEAGANVFGAEHAKEVAAHAREIKATGALYCDCPACAAVEAILEKKELLL